MVPTGHSSVQDYALGRWENCIFPGKLEGNRKGIIVIGLLSLGCCKRKSNRLTAGTARTANLKTSGPLMAMFVKDPSAEAPSAFKGFKPS